MPENKNGPKTGPCGKVNQLFKCHYGDGSTCSKRLVIKIGYGRQCRKIPPLPALLRKNKITLVS